MTCIVGIVGPDGNIFLGADSVGVTGMNLTPRADAKVFKKGSMLIGFCGSFRMGQLLRYKFQPPVFKSQNRTGESVTRYMVTDFVDEVRKCFRDGGYAKEHHKAESGGFFVVAYKGRLFEVQADYQVAESSEPWIAIGSGKDYALGSLATTSEIGGVMSPQSRVHQALLAAERYHAGVQGPFLILTSGNESDKVLS